MTADTGRSRDLHAAAYDLTVDHPMWIGDGGKPLDYLPEREARIGDFLDQLIDLREMRALIGLRERCTEAVSEWEREAADREDRFKGLPSGPAWAGDAIRLATAARHQRRAAARLRAALDATEDTTREGDRDA